MNKFNSVPDQMIIDETVKSLRENGINAIVVENKEEAKKKVLEMLPEGAEVMNNTSRTLADTGIADEILESGKYKSVRKEFEKMSPDDPEKRHLGAAPEWSIGSVHAITEDGHVMIASGSGSQLPGYAYGAANVIWVVGVQKIVKNFDEGLKRIYEHTLPLEDERMKSQGAPGSNVNKLLVINKERAGRLNLILIKEVIGF
jgi:hypothetical protein